MVVVEHDEETIRAADYVIDLGPGAGELGGRVIFQGPPGSIDGSLTGATCAASSRSRCRRRGARPAAGCA